MAAGNDAKLGPVYFWRPHEETYGVFSQWYVCPFEVDGFVYETAEAWMMIKKARLFGDEETAHQMTQTRNPAEHQRLGRQTKGFDKEKWNDHKSRIVEEGNYHKFTKSSESAQFAKLLLDTGDRELVESSPKDRVWGIGFSAEEADANREHWGENLLGKAMMNVRERLRKENK